MSEQQDYMVPEPVRRADSRFARRLERLSSRAQEVDRALAAVSEGKGGLVWTAEHGMGASATLELVCEAVATHEFAQPTVTLRCRPPAGVPAPGRPSSPSCRRCRSSRAASSLSGSRGSSSRSTQASATSLR